MEGLSNDAGAASGIVPEMAYNVPQFNPAAIFLYPYQGMNYGYQGYQPYPIQYGACCYQNLPVLVTIPQSTFQLQPIPTFGFNYVQQPQPMTYTSEAPFGYFPDPPQEFQQPAAFTPELDLAEEPTEPEPGYTIVDISSEPNSSGNGNGGGQLAGIEQLFQTSPPLDVSEETVLPAGDLGLETQPQPQIVEHTSQQEHGFYYKSYKVGNKGKKPMKTSIKKLRTNSCTLCLSNKEPIAYCKSHKLKDADGNVTCPVLKAVICPICGQTGKDAHTLRYCPANGYVDPISVYAKYQLSRNSAGQKQLVKF